MFLVQKLSLVRTHCQIQKEALEHGRSAVKPSVAAVDVGRCSRLETAAAMALRSRVVTVTAHRVTYHPCHMSHVGKAHNTCYQGIQRLGFPCPYAWFPGPTLYVCQILPRLFHQPPRRPFDASPLDRKSLQGGRNNEARQSRSHSCQMVIARFL